jgi:hypothetical protein
MYWILAAVCLIVMLAVPRLRPVALGGLVILGALLVWGMVERWRSVEPLSEVERGRPTRPASSVETVPVDEIGLERLQLTGGGAPFRLTGRVANRSATMQLKSLMLDITRRDCHAESLDPSGCTLLWQTRQWIELSVPPREEREFAVAIWARGEAPRPIGMVRDEFKIITANGQTVPQTSTGETAP